MGDLRGNDTPRDLTGGPLMNDLDRPSRRRLVDPFDYGARGLSTDFLDGLTRRPRRDILAIAVLIGCVVAISLGAGAQVVRSGSPSFAVEALRQAAAARRSAVVKNHVDQDGVMAQARGYVARHLEFYHAHDVEYRVALASPKGQEKLRWYVGYKLGGLFEGKSVFSEEPLTFRKRNDDAAVVTYPSYRFISALDEVEFELGRSRSGRWKVERISNDSLAKMFPDDHFLAKDFVAYLESSNADEGE